MINLCPPVAVGVVVVVINDPNFTLNCKRSIGLPLDPLQYPLLHNAVVLFRLRSCVVFAEECNIAKYHY